MLRLSRNVLILGVVSFFTDVSSEMILILLPLFYLTLGAGGAAIGLIEGLAESVSSLMKVFSGWYSDKIGRKKIFVGSGYCLSAVTKIFFAIATTWPQVLVIRFTERLGKGLRTSPRDALIAASTDEKTYGRAFGFHRAMDTAGAIGGVLLALILIGYLTYRQIFLLAVIPAAISVVFVLFVEEKKGKTRESKLQVKLTSKYRHLMLVVTIFGLANFSYAFLVLRANSLGASDKMVISLYLFYNIIYAAAAIPVGELADMFSRKAIVVFGYLLFASMCLGFAMTSDLFYVAFLFALYGVYQAVMEGVHKAYIAELVEEDVRGTAYGIFHTIIGLTALPASFIAGLLWQYVSPATAFIYGSSMASLAAALLILL
jgi:MFS family permease